MKTGTVEDLMTTNSIHTEHKMLEMEFLILCVNHTREYKHIENYFFNGYWKFSTQYKHYFQTAPNNLIKYLKQIESIVYNTLQMYPEGNLSNMQLKLNQLKDASNDERATTYQNIMETISQNAGTILQIPASLNYQPDVENVNTAVSIGKSLDNDTMITSYILLSAIHHQTIPVAVMALIKEISHLYGELDLIYMKN